MEAGISSGTHRDDHGLRKRNGPLMTDPAVVPSALAATGEVEATDKHGKAMKTFGRTPDGTGEYISFLKPHNALAIALETCLSVAFRVFLSIVFFFDMAVMLHRRH